MDEKQLLATKNAHQQEQHEVTSYTVDEQDTFLGDLFSSPQDQSPDRINSSSDKLEIAEESPLHDKNQLFEAPQSSHRVEVQSSLDEANDDIPGLPLRRFLNFLPGIADRISAAEQKEFCVTLEPIKINLRTLQQPQPTDELEGAAEQTDSSDILSWRRLLPRKEEVAGNNTATALATSRVGGGLIALGFSDGIVIVFSKRNNRWVQLFVVQPRELLRLGPGTSERIAALSLVDVEVAQIKDLSLLVVVGLSEGPIAILAVLRITSDDAAFGVIGMCAAPSTDSPLREVKLGPLLPVPGTSEVLGQSIGLAAYDDNTVCRLALQLHRKPRLAAPCQLRKIWSEPPPCGVATSAAVQTDGSGRTWALLSGTTGILLLQLNPAVKVAFQAQGLDVRGCFLPQREVALLVSDGCKTMLVNCEGNALDVEPGIKQPVSGLIGSPEGLVAAIEGSKVRVVINPEGHVKSSLVAALPGGGGAGLLGWIELEGNPALLAQTGEALVLRRHDLELVAAAWKQKLKCACEDEFSPDTSSVKNLDFCDMALLVLRQRDEELAGICEKFMSCAVAVQLARFVLSCVLEILRAEDKKSFRQLCTIAATLCPEFPCDAANSITPPGLEERGFSENPEEVLCDLLLRKVGFTGLALAAALLAALLPSSWMLCAPSELPALNSLLSTTNGDGLSCKASSLDVLRSAWREECAVMTGELLDILLLGKNNSENLETMQKGKKSSSGVRPWVHCVLTYVNNDDESPTACFDFLRKSLLESDNREITGKWVSICIDALYDAARIDPKASTLQAALTDQIAAHATELAAADAVGISQLVRRRCSGRVGLECQRALGAALVSQQAWNESLNLLQTTNDTDLISSLWLSLAQNTDDQRCIDFLQGYSENKTVLVDCLSMFWVDRPLLARLPRTAAYLIMATDSFHVSRQRAQLSQLLSAVEEAACVSPAVLRVAMELQAAARRPALATARLLDKIDLATPDLPSLIGDRAPVICHRLQQRLAESPRDLASQNLLLHLVSGPLTATARLARVLAETQAYCSRQLLQQHVNTQSLGLSALEWGTQTVTLRRSAVSTEGKPSVVFHTEDAANDFGVFGSRRK